MGGTMSRVTAVLSGVALLLVFVVLLALPRLLPSVEDGATAYGRGDYAAAEKWLQRVDSPQRALEVQTRRAMLLARQGKVVTEFAADQATQEGIMYAAIH